MGQSSVSILNKVGYSMFWSSMWDNKIIYSRLLKEDIYIEKFFDLIFSDNLSINIFNIKNLKQISYKNFKPFFFSISNKQGFNLYKYLKSSNIINSFNSKIWILKYQNWIIIYNFIYLQQFEKKFLKKKKLMNDFIYKNNFSYVLNLYVNVNKNLKYSYNLYNKNTKKVFF